MTTSELIIFLFSCAVISVLRFLLSSREGGGRGGGVTPYNGLYREAPPESGTYFMALSI